MAYLIDKLTAERGALDADTIRLWMGSGGMTVSCPELARVLDLSTHTIQCWRRPAGPRPRHLRARLIEAELALRDRRRRERRRAGASPAPAK